MSAVVLDFVWLAVGLLVLYLGAESFLRGAMALSQRLGVSPLVIGIITLTLVLGLQLAIDNWHTKRKLNAVLVLLKASH